MEISEDSKIVYYAAKLLTLAPFALRKKSNGLLEIRRSILCSIYSVVVIFLLIYLTYQGLLCADNSKMPIHSSFRMRSATSIVVTISDVSVVILSAMSGTLCGMWQLSTIRALNNCLIKIDIFLHSYKNQQKDRLRSILILLVPMLIIICQLAYDMSTWLRLAKRLKSASVDTEEEVNVQWYIPFYTLYLILTGLHCVVANSIYSLGYRYRRLNAKLKDCFYTNGNTITEEKRNTKCEYKAFNVKTIDWPVRPRRNQTLIDCHALNEIYPWRPVHDKEFTQMKLLRTIAEVHAALCKCMLLVSKAYGVAVMFIIISCFLHLVATAYFLFLELLTEVDIGYVVLQILWICFHIFRLLLIVEPCDIATAESRKTIRIVCEIERDVNDPILGKELHKLWQQLLAINGEFSACGLCTVNRRILTPIGSAIATYLVILIQFQKAND